ncbi:hypothetical protein NA56DRAFT_660171 [Hyaloscypha hepaticicola]|uniref:Uncharacterized protein n=1 Tax=Hyaloscypha hepaticicola TaxID=2082293 RepID=A0A2J6Q124_9HELO|nr:hypothetical protein NA56DRAFT_660171 [Hyaloscypha hepaticicola]
MDDMSQKCEFLLLSGRGFQGCLFGVDCKRTRLFKFRGNHVFDPGPSHTCGGKVLEEDLEEDLEEELKECFVVVDLFVDVDVGLDVDFGTEVVLTDDIFVEACVEVRRLVGFVEDVDLTEDFEVDFVDDVDLTEGFKLDFVDETRLLVFVLNLVVLLVVVLGGSRKSSRSQRVSVLE